MNLNQASILNNFCEENKEILLIFTQVNGSLSTYYRNKYGNISHKFKTCKRAKELEPGLVWVSLQNFDDSYKDLLKYFHPDLYKGKRTNDELRQVVECITNIKKSKSFYKIGSIDAFLASGYTGSKSEPIREEFEFSTYFELLGAGDFIEAMQDRIEGARWYQIHKQNSKWFEEEFFV